jgi:polyhydroxybutyrate depolymerase
VAAMALAVAGCGSSSGSPSPGTSAAGSAAAVGNPCRWAARASTTLAPEVGGHRRTVVVHVPPGYRAHRTALVLDLHGSGATAADQEAFSGMDTTADADGFIVAYPQGLIADHAGFDWNVPGEPLVGGRSVAAGAADDVSFLSALVTVLARHYCIDPRRVYATGFSGGGRMASQLACDASEVFAAVAPVSGLRRPAPCPATRPIPVVAFHGTADPVDPYAGNGEAYWTYSVPAAAAMWASQDGCAATPVTSDPVAGATLTAYPGCGGGAGVELYTLAGEGHEWPGGPVVPRALRDALGPQSDVVDADAVMWAFFSAHPMG